MENQLIVDYAISLTHLYGLVYKDKVVEIYKMQNEEKIDVEIIDRIMKEAPKELSDNFVEIHGDYFVTESIIEFENFEKQLNLRKGKPFYIPEKEELLKYKDETYFEKTEEYKNFVNYVTRDIFDGDEFKAEMLCDDVQGICQSEFSGKRVFDEFNRRHVNFKSDKQVSKVMLLVMELSNNTRIAENNGHTPSEIFELMERPNLRPLLKGGIPNLIGMPRGDRPVLRSIPGGAAKKTGRNDPCPCGSGKKYKKCCFGKE